MDHQLSHIRTSLTFLSLKSHTFDGATNLFPDGVGVAPLALPASLPETALEHPGVGLEVMMANLKVPEAWEHLYKNKSL